MKRRTCLAAIIASAALLAVPGVFADEAAVKVHRLAIHVDENDPARMNLALNNAENLNQYYQEKGEPVEIEIVAYGPGLHMLRADTSPVKDRIEQMSLALDNLSFAACGNTQKKMSEKAGKNVEIMAEATMVPSGVVRLLELQEQGWSYLRP